MTDLRYIAIEGNIGSGKTSLALKLHEKINSKLILEQFKDNPFLETFYKNPEKYAFPVELHFLMERVRQLEKAFQTADVFERVVLADYIFDKSRLFASINLDKREFQLFEDIQKRLALNFPKPDMLLYLYRPMESLLSNIKKRGRSFETEIDPEYLKRVDDMYTQYCNLIRDFPILILEMDRIGDLEEEAVVDFIIRQIHVCKKKKGTIEIKP